MSVQSLHGGMSYLGCVCIPETPQSIMLLRLNLQGHLELVTCLHKPQGLRAAVATHCMETIEWPCEGVGGAPEDEGTARRSAACLLYHVVCLLPLAEVRKL